MLKNATKALAINRSYTAPNNKIATKKIKTK